MKIEYRATVPIEMQQGATFRGHALVWGDSTGPLPELNGYRERVQKDALQWDDRTALYLGHSYEGQLPLARVGAGTLKFRNTDKGLEFEGSLPEWAGDLQESLQRRDHTGCVSVGFVCEGEAFDNRARLRTVKAGYLHHVALVMQGAYPLANGAMTNEAF